MTTPDERQAGQHTTARPDTGTSASDAGTSAPYTGNPVAFLRLHHATFTMPVGEEDRARAFYGGVLGMTEVPKPATMRPVGCWFGTGGVEIHGLPDEDFRPNRLGHPAILVDDLDALAARLAGHGAVVETDDRFPGHRRFHTYDCFGNQLEFLQADP
ncbi:hypothetical protein GCM10022252_44700 [Streptosporangium oxazolinicum]|uniref:VOC domain-containing protein n=1 Tax=Streptosporangium oxazolinicum TaxID=909287 RepID=A0ABP8B3H1_9ACTN